jgi:Family of unknown function (DUF5675)
MKIIVQRKWETIESICGELSVDNQFECFSLERPRTGDHPCIPAGTYDVILTPSPHLHYITPELLNVPDRTSIRIHIANTAPELLGCTAAGETHTPNFVGNSHDAFASLMTLLKTAATANEMITAEYRDPPAA